MFPEASTGFLFQSSTAILFSTVFIPLPIQKPGFLDASQFCWKGMSSDITAWCRECQGYNHGKVIS